ncbi:MAG: helicase-related protein [Gammaproteobacteria bacterium]
MLKLRAGAGPYRSFGNIAVEPRAYQLVPLMMALKQPTIRLLIADDVGIGKTIEAGLIAREMLDRGEITHLSVLCPPHLCEQWQKELLNRFHINAEVVRSSTAPRLERGLPAGSSVFSEYPFTVVSLDYIKSKVRRDAFAEQCPEFIIVDEAHTCSRSGQGRQQRYELLKQLSEDKFRHMVLLTATPHSGDEHAFYNLLGLLQDDFLNLREDMRADHPLRQKLAHHFVQRRREDIKEWQEGNLFPERFVAEDTYKLSGDWNNIFQEVLDYARELVEREEGAQLKVRMNWWAALALLRCISSSPHAAIRALNTRLDNAIGKSDEIVTDQELQDALEQQGNASVMDGVNDDLTFDDVEPGAAQQEDIERLNQLINRAKKLKSSGDPKLQSLIRNLKLLLEEGYKPVIFCRYIATAEYITEELAAKFKSHEVIYVTGNLTSAERETKIEGLKESDKEPILVATDCLSEGINLQDQFTAIIHYDLSWNPTRHEQREGRVDRFGQKAESVKALLLYGEDNPVDGAVLQVIIRKAEAIRKALGVSVPMPEDDNRVTQAILNTVLLRKDGAGQQTTLYLFDGIDEVQEMEAAWESAREKARKNRTVFAQQRLSPEQVMPEWEKAFSVLGSEEDVRRFVINACERLGAPLSRLSKGGYQLPIKHLTRAVLERLETAGFSHLNRIDFAYPSAAGCEFVSRTHPLVSHLADYLAEQAMTGEETDLIARVGVIKTADVAKKTTIFLLRLRSRLTIKRTADSDAAGRDMLSEEAMAVAYVGDEMQILDKKQVVELMQATPGKNLTPEARERELISALEGLSMKKPEFAQLAGKRAQEVLEDHRRARDAAEAKGTYSVKPQLPVDVMGIYILLPDAGLL